MSIETTKILDECLIYIIDKIEQEDFKNIITRPDNLTDFDVATLSEQSYKIEVRECGRSKDESLMLVKKRGCDEFVKKFTEIAESSKKKLLFFKLNELSPYACVLKTSHNGKLEIRATFGHFISYDAELPCCVIIDCYFCEI